MRALIIYISALIFLCLGCGEESDRPVSSLHVPELVPGTILQLSEDEPVEYRVVEEGGSGPGLLITFPPLEYKNFPRQSIRVAGRVKPGVEVSINESSVLVYPSGSFASLISLLDNPEEISIIAREDSNEIRYSIPVERTGVKPKKPEFVEFEVPKLGKVIKSHTPLQLLPGRVRLLTLFEDTVLRLTGREANFFCVDLGGGLSSWVRDEAVKEISTGFSGPFRVGNIEVDGLLSQAHFMVQTKVPARVEYISPSELKVIFYNATVDTQTIKLKDWEGNCQWFQERGCQVFILFQGEMNCYRWSMEWEKNGYSLTWYPRPTQGANPVVFIDPGHGGRQWGAVSPGGVVEKEANLDLAYMVAECLNNQGIKTVLSREEDVEVGLYQRIDRARAAGADLFVSLHFNSIGEDRDPFRRSGGEIFYYHVPSRELAGFISNALKEKGIVQNGICWKSLAVLRPTDIIGVLVEVAFLSHPGDEIKILDPDFRKNASEAIAAGIMEYLKK